MEGTTWDVRVAARGREAPVAHVRRHRFEVGPPLSFDRDEPRTTALEYVLGALGADLVGCLERAARRRRVEIDSIEATVQAELANPLTFLRVVGEEGDPSIRRVRVRVYATTGAAAADVDAAWREALETSPLASTFRRSLDLDLTLKTLL